MSYISEFIQSKYEMIDSSCCDTLQDKEENEGFKELQSIKDLRAELAIKYLKIIMNDEFIDDKISTMLIRKKYHTTLYLEEKTDTDKRVRRFEIMNTPLKYLIVDQEKRLRTSLKLTDKEWDLSLFQILDSKLNLDKFDSCAYEDSKRYKLVITRSVTPAEMWEMWRKFVSYFGGRY